MPKSADVNLHYWFEEGAGPLHRLCCTASPEFWYGWRTARIAALPQGGLPGSLPSARPGGGNNMGSSQPGAGVDPTGAANLADDARGLSRSAAPGSRARWPATHGADGPPGTLALKTPRSSSTVAIPHGGPGPIPGAQKAPKRGYGTPGQLRRSWYFF